MKKIRVIKLFGIPVFKEISGEFNGERKPITTMNELLAEKTHLTAKLLRAKAGAGKDAPTEDYINYLRRDIFKVKADILDHQASQILGE